MADDALVRAAVALVSMADSLGRVAPPLVVQPPVRKADVGSAPAAEMSMRERLARRLAWLERMSSLRSEPRAGSRRVYTWEEESESDRRRFLMTADSVLSTLREPTAAMVESAWASALVEDARGVWRDMIDAAGGEHV